MQCCNLVPMTMVQSKLDELLPLLTKAQIDKESKSELVKMNYLFLFRKVLVTQVEEVDNRLKTANLNQFVPKILNLLESSLQSVDEQKKVLIEGLSLLIELQKLYPDELL